MGTHSNPKKLSITAKNATPKGSDAGRGFRYQDAVSAWLAIEIWASRRPPAIMIPEGGDDVELRGAESTLVQIKSRREHLGDYSAADTVKYIHALWSLYLGCTPPPKRLELFLERNVAGFIPLEGQLANQAIQGPVAVKLSQYEKSEILLPKTSVTISASPQECSIGVITDKLSCSPIAAQMCFAELLVRVGNLADANGRVSSNEYCGLSVNETETTIRDVLAAVDVASIESAIREGICEPVDFLKPLNDPNFYLGVDVEPGHIAAGLVAERPESRATLVQGIEDRRVALVVGPSGAGKSALMWEVANALRHSVRWFRIRRLGSEHIPAIRQLIRTFRASSGSPVGLVMDDVGRTSPDGWGALLKEVASVSGVVMLGSVREEDVTLIAERARAVEVRAEPDHHLAERLWKELRDSGKTNWDGWREPWTLSNGLLLEYVHILTRGIRMKELLSEQVRSRISDPARSVELDILRTCAWAGAANAEIDAARLAVVLSINEAELSRAMQRLIEEHLIRTPTPGTLAGLHQLRSEELLRLTHDVPLPTLETSCRIALASVPNMEVEPLVGYALTQQRLSIASVIDSLIYRLDDDQVARSLAFALRGLAIGHIFAGVDEWLDTPEARGLPRTQIGSAMFLGITDTNLGGIGRLSKIQAAAGSLSKIKHSTSADPRRLLMDRINQSTLPRLIHIDDLWSLNEILDALVGLPLPARVRSTLRRPPPNLLDADLSLLTSLLGTLAVLDREIAIQWVDEIGQEILFEKIQATVAWSGVVSTENTSEGMAVCCDLWFVAESVQGNPHSDVVSLCESILAICPLADISMSNATIANGELAGIANYPLATKRISRENLPPPSVPRWNQRWANQIFQRVAAPSHSNYLTRGISILNELETTIDKVLDSYLRGKSVKDDLFQRLNELHSEAEALTPPAIPLSSNSGIGIEVENTTVTKFQNLLHSASVDLFNRFVKLPEHAGAYIAWLNSLILDVESVILEEPWQLIASDSPPALERLKVLLETLRLLAGEAHERQARPQDTWAARGKRARSGDAVRQLSHIAMAAGKRRLDKRKAEIELATMAAEIDATFHIRFNSRGILPWPPVDVLALLSASNVTDAVISIHQHSDFLQSLVGDSVNFTVMPIINGVTVPALTSSGYQTLLPDAKGGALWSEELGLKHTTSPIAALFGDVLTLAGELGSMDCLGLGVSTRPDAEVLGRRTLATNFTEKKGELTRYMDALGCDINVRVFELIDCARSGDIDFAAVMRAAIIGSSSEFSEDVGLVRLHLIDLELQFDI